VRRVRLRGFAGSLFTSSLFTSRLNEVQALSSRRRTRPKPSPRKSQQSHLRLCLTEHGAARDCRITKPLPLLDRVAAQAQLESRFAPATFRSENVAANYLFTFDFELP